MATAFAPSRLFSRLTAYPAHLWRVYNTALREKPLRTRMISSGVLYIIGDHVAQIGIEDKRWMGSWRSAATTRDGATSKEDGVKEGGVELDVEEEGMFDWGRLMRMSLCALIRHLAGAREEDMECEDREDGRSRGRDS